jgi:hypothetical protein
MPLFQASIFWGWEVRKKLLLALLPLGLSLSLTLVCLFRNIVQEEVSYLSLENCHNPEECNQKFYAIYVVGFEVLAAVNMKIVVFLVAT